MILLLLEEEKPCQTSVYKQFLYKILNSFHGNTEYQQGVVLQQVLQDVSYYAKGKGIFSFP